TINVTTGRILRYVRAVDNQAGGCSDVVEAKKPLRIASTMPTTPPSTPSRLPPNRAGTITDGTRPPTAIPNPPAATPRMMQNRPRIRLRRGSRIDVIGRHTPRIQ